MRRYYTSEKILLPIAGRKLAVYLFRPTQNRKPPAETPGILWIHGGGYVLGMAKMIYISRALPLVKRYGGVVLTPEYRLAKQAPYPAALEDCYAALKYLQAHAKQWGVNPAKLMVGGESAGGGLAAALCMYARDQGEVNIAFQMPLYPMLDDRDTDSSRDNHGHVWNTKRNHWGWKAYLGENYGKAVPAYAAPARQTCYAGLPPAYTFVGDREPFYCETLAYIRRLQQAGIPAKVDVYHSSTHAFDMLLPFRRISKQAARAFEQQYLYAVRHYSAPQPPSRQNGKAPTGRCFFQGDSH